MNLLRQALSAIGKIFKRLYQTVLAVAWLTICYLYIVWWTINSSWRRLFTESAIVIVLAGTLLVCGEIAAGLLGRRIDLIELPNWADALLLLLAMGLVYHRFNEFRQARKESIFAMTVATIFQEVPSLEFIPENIPHNWAVLGTFVQKVLLAFSVIYRPKRQLQANVMLLDESRSLRIHFVYPKTAQYDPEISFAPTRGGAGIAFADRATIYFPAIRFRHGISFKENEYQLLPMAYVPSRIQPFKSVICTPIVCGPLTLGVLNIDSTRQNAFSMMDIQIARVAASALGMAIDRYHANS